MSISTSESQRALRLTVIQREFQTCGMCSRYVSRKYWQFSYAPVTSHDLGRVKGHRAGVRAWLAMKSPWTVWQRWPTNRSIIPVSVVVPSTRISLADLVACGLNHIIFVSKFNDFVLTKKLTQKW